MSFVRPRLLVAIDASAVTGAMASWERGGPRVTGLVRAPLSPGAVTPSPMESNVGGANELREALASVRKGLGINGRRATLILPEGVAKVLVVDLPGGVAIKDFARFRVAAGLSYPAAEAVVDSLPVGGGRHLCAAIRRSIVEGYESATRAAGFNLDRVEIAPFAAVAGLLRQAASAERGVVVLLGDAALSLVAFHEGTLTAFRSRRRDPGGHEAARIRDEVLRTASLAGDDGVPQVAILGPGSAAMAERLHALGCSVRSPWHSDGHETSVEAAELAWLGASLG